MNKKLKIGLIIVSILLLISAIAVPLIILAYKEKNEIKTNEENNSTKESSIMWEVTSKDGKGKLYLLGSIHVAKESMYPLNESITNAFNKSNKLVVENDVIATENNPDILLELLDYVMYTDGTTIKDHIPASLFSLLDIKIKSGIEGIEKDYAYYYKPIAYQSIIMENIYKESGFDSEYGIDMHFLKEAKKRNMEIIELETAEFQYSVLSSLSEDMQSAMLASVLLAGSSGTEYLNELLEAWEKGELKTFENALKEGEEQEINGLNEEELKAYLEYNKKMIDDRNDKMSDKAMELLNKNDTYFYIVGAAHMVGENGIVQKLIDEGYKVEKK